MLDTFPYHLLYPAIKLKSVMWNFKNVHRADRTEEAGGHFAKLEAKPVQ